MSKALAAVVAGLSAVLCLPLVATAEARIVLSKGIAGVNVGDTQGQVTKRLGKPRKVLRRDLAFAGFVVWFYDRAPLDGWVNVQKGRVIGVVTRSTRQRTAEGVGPGSTYADYLKAYSNSQWKRAGYRGGCERGTRSYGCILARLKDGPAKSTSFANKAVRDGRVGFAVVMVGLGRLMLDDTDLE